MNAYHINIAPHKGVGIGFIAVGENENHALAELSLSLRQSLKIFRAHLSVNEGTNTGLIYEEKIQRNLELLRTVRKPGRYAFVNHRFYKKDDWPKVTVTQITKAVTAAYVKEVWLGFQ
jgi:hypothetical protein